MVLYDLFFENSSSDNFVDIDNSENVEEIEEPEEVEDPIEEPEEVEEPTEEPEEVSESVSVNVSYNGVATPLFIDNMTITIFLLSVLIGVALFGIFKSKL